MESEIKTTTKLYENNTLEHFKAIMFTYINFYLFILTFSHFVLMFSFVEMKETKKCKVAASKSRSTILARSCFSKVWKRDDNNNIFLQ